VTALEVVGAQDAATFLRRSTPGHLELLVHNDETHSLIEAGLCVAVAVLKTQVPPDSSTDSQRAITFGLRFDPDSDSEIIFLDAFRSIIHDLAFIDMPHTITRQFFGLAAEFPQLQTLQTNFQDENENFWSVDDRAGRCPSLKLLHIYSATKNAKASVLSGCRVPVPQLVAMYRQMGFFRLRGCRSTKAFNQWHWSRGR